MNHENEVYSVALSTFNPQRIFYVSPFCSCWGSSQLCPQRNGALAHWRRKRYSGRPWRFLLISHDEIALNIALTALAAHFGG
jgi:hypothetical protein